MIAQLKGEVAEMRDSYIILLVNGVGYKVYTTLETIKNIKKSGSPTISINTHLAVRENALDLYGFLKNDELNLFKMLISISGIGPKTAVAILNVADVDTLKTAISTGESSYLTKVSGIGKKNAEKIILELRDKLGAIDQKEDATLMKDEIETIEALQALGYSVREARDAMKKISKDAKTSSQRIKEALKTLGGQK